MGAYYALGTMLSTVRPSHLIVANQTNRPSWRRYSLSRETAAPGERPQGRGSTSGTPFHARLADRAETTAALGWGGACFQPDRVPGRSGALRLRAQPVAAPALRTCARCLRGAWALGCASARSVPAPGAWGGLEESVCEVERSPGRVGPASIPPRCPGTRRGDATTSAPIPFPVPRLPTASLGEPQSFRGRRRKDASPPPLLGVESQEAFPPDCGQSRFHACPSFPGVGFCSLWARLDSLDASGLWVIWATAGRQGPLSFAARLGREVRV